MSDLYLWLVHKPTNRRFKLAMGVNSLRTGAGDVGSYSFVNELDDFFAEGGYPSNDDYIIVLENETS